MSCPRVAAAFLGPLVNEVQTITCTGNSGTFQLKFREQTTITLNYNQRVSGTEYSFTGVTVTVVFGTNTVVTSSDQSSLIAVGDIIILTNEAGTESREYLTTAVSTVTITTSQNIGMVNGTTYSLKKKIDSVNQRYEILRQFATLLSQHSHQTMARHLKLRHV